LSSCTTCQPQCLNCTSGRPAYECTACSNNTLYYFNKITYQCTLNCTPPYYANTAAPLACYPCQLPCKTCATYYTSCTSCYNGYYLLNQICSTSCPINYYTDSINNTCTACPNLCATCTSLSCLTCTLANYFYAGTCYSSCPANAPFVYGIYCRNCLTDRCLVCNSDGMCSLCAANTYNYNGMCVSTCP
jgi:proprotein convertase subtilisin/kexin type 5